MWWWQFKDVGSCGPVVCALACSNPSHDHATLCIHAAPLSPNLQATCLVSCIWGRTLHSSSPFVMNVPCRTPLMCLHHLAGVGVACHCTPTLLSNIDDDYWWLFKTRCRRCPFLDECIQSVGVGYPVCNVASFCPAARLHAAKCVQF